MSNHLKLSVIIAAKDEEKNIPSLVKSLEELNYPKERFEVIIVDDNSSDRTFQTAKELIKCNSNFYLFKAGAKEFPGKKGALSFGIKKSNNPFIVITDADCTPEKDWLKSYCKKFYDGYDFLFGNAPFLQDHIFVNKVSCFENLRNSLLTFTAAKIGIPYSASARNFGFKRSCFDKINGYKNTTETLSGDDDLLLREAVKNKMKIGTFLNRGSFVFSSTKKNFKDYFEQRARHTKTSFYYMPARQLGLVSWHLANLLFLFSPFLIFFNRFFILLFLSKIFFDLFIVKSFQKKFGYAFNSIEIIYLQVIYELFLVIHFFNAIFKKEKWK
jgi:cellulose synthase/poly-beta-1,6-N-acetylglucosamine synthase-like glycosyltransferase